MNSSFTQFLLAILAAWRLTHLLAREDGPFDLLLRIRLRLGQTILGKLMDCFYCLSLWVSAPIAWLAFGAGASFILGWLGLSGAACLIERLLREPVIVQPDTPAEETANL